MTNPVIQKDDWFYCNSCETWAILCPKCGNNCCNAMYGQVKQLDRTSVTCDFCPEVYKEADRCGWDRPD